MNGLSTTYFDNMDLSNDLNHVRELVQSIAAVPLDDGFVIDVEAATAEFDP